MHGTIERDWTEWPAEHVEKLKIRFFEGKLIREIAAEVGHTEVACKSKILRLGLKRIRPRWMTWTEERVAILKQMWAAGDYASQIAEALGMSRNAVLGKIHRLGLSGREPKKSYRVPRPRASRPRAPRPSRIKIVKGPKLIMARPVRQTCAAFDAAIPRDRLKPIWEIGQRECHWPIGDPGEEGFGFCCAATDGATYCPEHTYFAHARVREKPKHSRHSFGSLGRAA